MHKQTNPIIIKIIMRLIGRLIVPSSSSKSRNNKRRNNKRHTMNSQMSYIQRSSSSSYSYDSDNEDDVLFTVYDENGDYYDDIIGETTEDINKPRPVNENVLYGDLIIAEEKRKINKIYKKYEKNFEIGTKEKIQKDIDTIKKDTNWKLRILNELE